MKAYCEKCRAVVECDVSSCADESITLRGKQFIAPQQHAYCPNCSEEVYPNALIDYNVTHAHNAYRHAIGSITGDEIQAILTKYNIGAQPLSRLLGWGDNTIERQMKHTIPDREHANRLKSLDDPYLMRRLLEEGRTRISPVAFHKAMQAVDEILSSDKEIIFRNSGLDKVQYSLPEMFIYSGIYHVTFQALARRSKKLCFYPI